MENHFILFLWQIFPHCFLCSLFLKLPSIQFWAFWINVSSIIYPSIFLFPGYLFYSGEIFPNLLLRICVPLLVIILKTKLTFPRTLIFLSSSFLVLHFSLKEILCFFLISLQTKIQTLKIDFQFSQFFLFLLKCFMLNFPSYGKFYSHVFKFMFGCLHINMIQ